MNNPEATMVCEICGQFTCGQRCSSTIDGCHVPRKLAATPAPDTEPAERPEQTAQECSHPDCHVQLGLTSTDLGNLCGLHVGHALDICRGEERLMEWEAKLKVSCNNYEALKRSHDALVEALKAVLHVISDEHGWGTVNRMEGSQLYTDAITAKKIAEPALANAKAITEGL